MKCRNIIAVAAVGFMLTGCGIYNKYEQNTQTPSDAFGTDKSIQAATSETTIAQMSWREFFTDPLLQQLIEQVLANNTDLNSARIAVEKSQAALTAAKLAYSTIVRQSKPTTCRCSCRWILMCSALSLIRSAQQRPRSYRLRCKRRPYAPISYLSRPNSI